MKIRMRDVLAAAALGAAAIAQAQDAASLRSRSLAATCAACHGTDGRVPAGVSVNGLGGLGSLAGMPADRLVAQMQAFKNGSRPATVMHQIAKGYSDARIAELAAYFAAQAAEAPP